MSWKIVFHFKFYVHSHAPFHHCLENSISRLICNYRGEGLAEWSVSTLDTLGKAMFEFTLGICSISHSYCGHVQQNCILCALLSHLFRPRKQLQGKNDTNEQPCSCCGFFVDVHKGILSVGSTTEI
jgi:hypothetical protein